MTREDIIRMAREAGLHYSGRCTLTGMESHIERFAALVASAEREACAKECEHTAVRMGSEWMAHHCAEAIRARGNTEQFEPCPFIECDCDGNHPLNQPAIQARGQEPAPYESSIGYMFGDKR
jgi:hypothetical protein